MPELSIIIPVYNAERYLERCLDSVLASLKEASASQKLDKFEVLLIDNESRDGSLAILKQYAEKYPEMITVLQCHTPGAGTVRNLGVSKAKGKFIWFIDADDAIDKTAVKKLLAEAEKTNADLVMMGMKRIFEDGKTNYLSAVSASEKNYKSRFIRYGLGPVQVLIRREWWIKNNFKFREKAIQEDMELMSALILYTDKFTSIDEPLYLYYQNNDSVLHKQEFSPHIFDIFPALDGLYGRFEEAGATSKYHDELEWFIIWNLLIDSAKDFIKFQEGKSGFKRSRKMLKKYFPDWRKNKFLKQKPLKLRLLVRLNYLR